VILFNRDTGEQRLLAKATARGKRRFVYSGQVAGNYAAWGKVAPGGQDVSLYDIAAGTTSVLTRPRGIFARYDPAVTASGTVYFAQTSSACRPPVELVRQPLGGSPAALARLAAGADAGYMYALAGGAETDVVYSRFRYGGCERGGSPRPGAIFKLVDH
jgi:hypothetical protein